MVVVQFVPDNVVLEVGWRNHPVFKLVPLVLKRRVLTLGDIDVFYKPRVFQVRLCKHLRLYYHERTTFVLRLFHLFFCYRKVNLCLLYFNLHFLALSTGIIRRVNTAPTAIPFAHKPGLRNLSLAFGCLARFSST